MNQLKKQVKDLNIRPETIKVLEENIDRKLHYTGLGMIFWISHKSKGNKSRKRLVNTSAQKENNIVKRQFTEWEKICVSHKSSKCLISKIYKELLQPNSKNQITQLK